jgi:hypothetical protein
VLEGFSYILTVRAIGRIYLLVLKGDFICFGAIEAHSGSKTRDVGLIINKVGFSLKGHKLSSFKGCQREAFGGVDPILVTQL